MHRQQGINPFVQHFCLFIFSPFFFFTDKHQMANVLFLVRKKKRLCANTTWFEQKWELFIVLLRRKHSQNQLSSISKKREIKYSSSLRWQGSSSGHDHHNHCLFYCFCFVCFFKSFYLLSHAWSDWSYSLVLLLTQSHHLIIFWKVIQRRTCTLKP